MSRRVSKKSTVAIAVDLGGNNLRAALVSSEAKILHRISVPTAKGRPRTKVSYQIIDLCFLLQSLANQEKQHIVGIGLGIPGFLRPNGLIRFSPNFPKWKGFHLGKKIQSTLKTKLIFENDANCAALGERWSQSKKKKYEHMIYITLGTGVGGGIISHGQLVRGAHFAAGEIGHISVLPHGPKSTVGGPGTLESLASGSALQKKTGLSGLALMQKARKGSALARKQFQDLGTYLGISISSLCFILDPDAVIIGGNLAGAFSFFAPSLRKEMKRRLKNHPAIRTRLCKAQTGDNAGLLGAAYLVFHSQKTTWN